jgi:curved DNA-binding protein CbpA
MRTDKAGRSYTSEQMQEVQRILRTKDYYDIIGVPKDSSEENVKKAYKKLALKLHPDKNKAPGAEEAFKKVSRAVQCLTDPEKKRDYDRYGDEDRIPQQHRQRYQQDFMTPEDLFNAFFNGGVFPSQHHHHHSGGHPGGGDGNPQVQRAQLFQLMPVILLVVLSLFSNMAGREGQSRFSFQPNGQFQNERTTSELNVPFYVANDFEDRYGEGTRAMADFERQVEVYFVRNLHSECDYQEKVLYKKVMLAKRRGDQDELEKARKTPKPACKDLEKIKKTHMHIYRSALYTGY